VSASGMSKSLGHLAKSNLYLNLNVNSWKLGMLVGRTGTAKDGNGTGNGNGNGTGNGNNGNEAKDEEGTPPHASVPNVKMWERRRLVLEGRLLMYYHEDAGLEEEDMEELATINYKQQALAIQRLKHKFNEFAENAHLKPKPQSSNSAIINTPWGVIDLVASHATAAIVPINSYSFAPTPYCLAVTIRSEMKWMLCFDSEKEVVKWLNVFTKVALKQSVETYQKEHGRVYAPVIVKTRLLEHIKEASYDTIEMDREVMSERSVSPDIRRKFCFSI
jgi:hypothetical protein